MPKYFRVYILVTCILMLLIPALSLLDVPHVAGFYGWILYYAFLFCYLGIVVLVPFATWSLIYRFRKEYKLSILALGATSLFCVYLFLAGDTFL